MLLTFPEVKPANQMNVKQNAVAKGDNAKKLGCVREYDERRDPPELSSSFITL